MSDIVHRLRTHIAQANAMFASKLLEDAAWEIERLRSEVARQRPRDCPRSPEGTPGDDPYSRDPIARQEAR